MRSDMVARLSASAALAALLIAGPAFAQQPAPQPEAQQPATPPASPAPASPAPAAPAPPAPVTPSPSSDQPTTAPVIPADQAAPAGGNEPAGPTEPAGTEAQADAHAGPPTHFPLKVPEMERWSFSGIFGKFDQGQLQRGLRVYREVCMACHSLSLIAFRNLAEEGGPGYSIDQVRALAAEFTVTDGPNETGEMFERPAVPSDRFPAPFPNLQAAAAANGGKAPPDLSLMAKARASARPLHWAVLDVFTAYQEAGADYIHALLTGYEEPASGLAVPPGTYYNPYFQSGLSLAMPPPLSDGVVPYDDGSPQTVDQYARDVSAFLAWTAEPKLVERKRIGFQVGIFLLVFAGLMYLAKRKVWAAVAH